MTYGTVTDVWDWTHMSVTVKARAALKQAPLGPNARGDGNISAVPVKDMYDVE